MNRSSLTAICCVTSCAVVSGCERDSDDTNHDSGSIPPATRSLQFTDVTSSSGIDMTLTSGEHPVTAILEVKGGGLALIDYDNDSDWDVFVPNGATLKDVDSGPGARLFRNDGHGTFTDTTDAAGITHRRWSMGVAIADVNADGHDDIYIACFGPNVLLLNDGDGGFIQSPQAGGAAGDAWSAAATFGDIDADGDLDLFVVNYLEFDPDNPPPDARHKGQVVFGGPAGCEPTPDVLYINDGTGNFTDETAARIGDVPAAFGLNAIIIDVDGDGDQDILVGNDSMPNELFQNRGNGTFDAIGMRSGFAANGDGHAQATMGMSIADVDGNGTPDCFSTNFANDTNTLLLNDGETWFCDGTRQFGFGLRSRAFLGWACGYFDFDHDADEDLLIFNGHVYPNASWETMDAPYRQTPLLFRRDGDRFSVASDAPGLTEAHCDRAAAFGDIDGDGDIDVIVGELNGPDRTLRNDIDGVHDWIIIRLEQPAGTGNRRAIGARVTVTCGEQSHTRWVLSGGSFQSANATDIHVGLGGDDHVPDDQVPVEVTVHWPDGGVQRLQDVQRGVVTTVRRAE